MQSTTVTSKGTSSHSNAKNKQTLRLNKSPPPEKSNKKTSNVSKPPINRSTMKNI